MSKQLIVKDEMMIEATREKVWDVLIKPKYVAIWDELPENYPEDDMTVGSEVVWDYPGGQTVTKIIKAEKNKQLVIALSSTNWEVQPQAGDIAYTYTLEDHNGKTLLKIEIGDFSLLKDGKNYYDASVEFAADSKQIIKQLAEKLQLEE